MDCWRPTLASDYRACACGAGASLKDPRPPRRIRVEGGCCASWRLRVLAQRHAIPPSLVENTPASRVLRLPRGARCWVCHSLFDSFGLRSLVAPSTVRLNHSGSLPLRAYSSSSTALILSKSWFKSIRSDRSTHWPALLIRA